MVLEAGSPNSRRQQVGFLGLQGTSLSLSFWKFPGSWQHNSSLPVVCCVRVCVRMCTCM